jgi:hypothetical protein
MLIGLAVVAGLAATGAAVAAGRDHRPAPVSPAAVTAPVVGECSPGAGRPVAAGASAAPVAVPDGWLWHTDPAGFALPVPGGWTRTVAGARVCFTDPDGLRSFSVATGRAGTGDPLREWQSTERSVLSGTALPGYRRVSMGVLLVSGGGADWEYTWEPAGGPRLHTHRVLLAATGKRPFRLTWTTREQDWALSRAAERTFLDGFRDRAASASPWAVPSP